MHDRDHSHSEGRVRVEPERTQRRLQRRLFLDWISMIGTSWQHSQTMKAAAIRNHTAILTKRLARCTAMPSAMEGVAETIAAIDGLAQEIASASPRVPQSWETEAELFPLASLLTEVARRGGKLSASQASSSMQIRTEVGPLAGVQVRGDRRWFIYALEVLFQSATKAMPDGGTITVTGQRAGDWAMVRISDTGSGVPMSMQHELFKEPASDRYDQLGMGISGPLVAAIIEEHGGTVELETPGPGDTTVLIRLPIAEKAGP